MKIEKKKTLTTIIQLVYLLLILVGIKVMSRKSYKCEMEP